MHISPIPYVPDYPKHAQSYLIKCDNKKYVERKNLNTFSTLEYMFCTNIISQNPMSLALSCNSEELLD